MTDQVPESTEEQAESTGPVVSSDSAVSTSTEETGDYNSERVQQLLDMKVPVIAKVAERSLTVKAVMKLHMGSVIQFEKDAYDHIELMVNNRTIGLGQPVKVGENFGLRLIQVGDVNDMIRSLGSNDE